MRSIFFKKSQRAMVVLMFGLMSGWCVVAHAQYSVWMDANKPLEERVEALLKELTIEEKVALCHAQSKFSSTGVPRLGLPELWHSDGPNGVRAEIKWDSWDYAGWRNDSCTAYPVLTCLAATFDPEMAYLFGQSLGQEARYRNKSVILGPGVNIYRVPFNGRNFEYMGEDPYLASVMVKPYIKGVQENGVAACVKHFALNNQEIDRGHIDVEVSERALREIYLPAFQAAASCAWTFMGSYNKYKGQHCCHNQYLLNDILKNEWQFDGAVISDWGGAHNTDEAVNNGLDIEMGTYTNGLTSESNFGYNNYFLANPFLMGLKNGTYSMEKLDDKARRILRLMLRTTLNSKRPLGSFATEEHLAVARKVAESGMVLLKNDGILPLSDKIQKIAVIGENATRSLTKGGGSSELKTWREISPLQGIRNRYPQAQVVYSMAYHSGKAEYSREGVSAYDSDSLFRAAVETAADADVVIFVGGLNKNHKQDCEASDRYAYELPFGQPKLIEAIAAVNPNLVVVLLSGNAVETSWAPKVKALLQAWYMGSESGNALAAVLSGDVNPSGKLPFSFPKKIEDNAAISFGKLSYPGDGQKQVYMEDILVGYRWHDTKKIPAAYPFGYGLSYTTFQLGKPQSDKKIYREDEVIKMTVSLGNIGQRDGAEVVQCYVGDPKSSVLRPQKELKAFAKVYLKAGETTQVCMDIPVSSLAFYDEQQHAWKVEPGDYLIYTATSSNNIKGTTKIKVE